MAPPRGNHTEARGTRPVDQIADEGWLIAVGEAVDDARLRRTAREQRAAQRVGFDGDVDDMLGVAEGSQAMLDRGQRMTGAFDHDIDLRMADERFPVVGHVRGFRLQRCIDGRGAEALAGPADAGEVRAGIRRRDVGDGRDVHTWRLWNLREVHRAELARADQADDERLAVGGPLAKLRVQAHGWIRYTCQAVTGFASADAGAPSRLRQSSGRHSIGVKSRCAMYSGRWNRRM